MADIYSQVTTLLPAWARAAILCFVAFILWLICFPLLRLIVALVYKMLQLLFRGMFTMIGIPLHFMTKLWGASFVRLTDQSNKCFASVDCALGKRARYFSCRKKGCEGCPYASEHNCLACKKSPPLRNTSKGGGWAFLTAIVLFLAIGIPEWAELPIETPFSIVRAAFLRFESDISGIDETELLVSGVEAEVNNDCAIVTGIQTSLAVRSSPDASANQIQQLYNNDEVQLLGETTQNDGFSWTKIQTSNGSVGWVKSDYLEIE